MTTLKNYWSIKIKLKSIFRKKCKHEFDTNGLYQTGIVYPKKPKDPTLQERIDYINGIYTCDAHTKRVAWPCAICGEVFYAHCGLDIIPKHGKIIRS